MNSESMVGNKQKCEIILSFNVFLTLFEKFSFGRITEVVRGEKESGGRNTGSKVRNGAAKQQVGFIAGYGNDDKIKATFLGGGVDIGRNLVGY